MNDESGWRVTPAGSTESGWIVDIHDGTNADVYFPDAPDADAAAKAARAEHMRRYWALQGQTTQVLNDAPAPVQDAAPPPPPAPPPEPPPPDPVVDAPPPTPPMVG